QGNSGNQAVFLIQGTHIYEHPGTNIPIVVYVNGPDGTSTSTQTGYATVAPNPNGLALGHLPPTHWDMNLPGYHGTIATSGANGNYGGLTVSGLPAGLTAGLSGQNIVISGTPTQAGSFDNIDVSVADSNGGVVQGIYHLTINPAVSLGPLSPIQGQVN